ISVAAVANISQWLYYFDWSGWSIQPATWAVIMLAVASLLGILMAWLENDTFYTLVLIWAFIGITVSQAGASLVVLAAWTGVALLAVALLGSFLKFKKIY
ncbi:MAG: tryptophan-rich sensory protein, partial [Anaerolineales bacterium]